MHSTKYLRTKHMNKEFSLSKKHSCNNQYFEKQRNDYSKRENTTQFIKDIDSIIEEYSDIYQPYLITFNVDKTLGYCYITEYPDRKILTQILKKTFNRIHNHFFGKLDKHNYLDFMKIGTYGIGIEESCFDHYHYIFCLPPFLIPKLEEEFNRQVKKLLYGFEGKMHYKTYNKSIKNFLGYGTRYYSNLETNNAKFDGIDLDVSCLNFSLNQLNHISENEIKTMHEKNLEFYKNKYSLSGIASFKAPKVTIVKPTRRIKETPFSDRSLYDFNYRSMF
ncbi:hypothetical protein LEP1GSC202_0443 [Leptospira yanagawae serovar Saopaulo str. Sao Paulo = ATCC 700523]|uniref:Uncharacterized protein n=2 Tax=Leptospira yanagawae TaxID=293069 RepID=A0A5E8HIF4_9LEPT|nr:hypothetical protein LEP1GSC202_0443 [Leptospira yanagawae serovar Saopaulo str. Sao Paulo = ATCC 700523]